MSENKILEMEELARRVKALKRAGKKIVHCHGCFDLMHPGHIKYFESAKKMGDILVVTVTPDHYVDKGPGRPVFKQQLRADSIASLECVDFVAINKWKTAEETLRLLRPNIYVKGQEFENLEDKTGKIQREAEVAKEVGAEVKFTHDVVFSSTRLINEHFDIYPPETKRYLRMFSSKYDFEDISGHLDKLKKLRVLLIGDGIIDEYHYCDPMGKSAKANLVVNKYKDHEVFVGGAFIIANHIAGLCRDVHLVTLLGKHDSREEFVRKSMKPNVDFKAFYRDDGPTIVKKRYINQYLNQKLFEINFINDSYIEGEQEAKIIDYLKSEIGKYDVVLVSDFGHGFITRKIIRLVQSRSKKYAINTQTNAANTGYNLVTKYRRPYFICIDESEIRMAAQEKHLEIEAVAKKIKKAVRAQYLIVTLGRTGSLAIGEKGEINWTPIFSTKVVDTIGAGDAFFAFTSPCLAVNMPLDLVSFIGNAVGALAVQIVGNKKPVEKHELLEFINTLLK